MYTGVFLPTEEITNNVKKWYDDGTEIVFSCGGAILYSVIEATDEKEDRKMTGEKITKKETYFLPCTEVNCAAFDISSLKCKLVERVNHI